MTNWIEIGSDAFDRPIDDSFNFDKPIVLIDSEKSIPVYRHVLIEKQSVEEDDETLED